MYQFFRLCNIYSKQFFPSMSCFVPSSIDRSAPVLSPELVSSPPRTALSGKEIIAFGRIHEEASRGVRSSGWLRSQPNADMTQFERVMMIAQRRDEMVGQGMCPPQTASLISFSDDQILDKSFFIGCFSGGISRWTLSFVKMINELEHMLTMLKNQEKCSNIGEEAPHSCCLTCFRSKWRFGGRGWHIVQPAITKDRRIRKKKSCDKTKVRISNRIRLSKSKS
jgi:hypothetical protein